MRPTAHSQLEVIYRQLGRSSGFRGFTPAFVIAVAGAAAGATGLVAILAPGRSLWFAAVLWTFVGTAIALVVGIAVLVPAARSASGIRREAAQATAIQMAFPLVVGFAATAAILVRHPEAIGYLPAIWLALFGLGVAALAGLIRERVEYAAIFYLASAAAAYALRPDGAFTFNLAVGAPFTVGHLLTAWILKTRDEESAGGTVEDDV
ncbi:MAG TPA: hypothetical protein VKA06_10960 [Spirochaetia bacterium]|nr:hypothetical protein [Spirochaetia bacterium]